MNIKTIGIALVVLFAATFAMIGSATAAVDFVYPGDSIQAAINDADPGDTIVITGGDYTENVIVNESVAIISTGLYAYLHAEGYVITGSWWWITGYYPFDVTIEYDEDVTVTAADPEQNVFTVESDDVLICNIELDYSGSGSIYFYGGYIWDWYFGYVEWEYLIYDYPMAMTGAYKSDAAGVFVDGADGTELINLLTTGNDNGIVLNGATNTYIEDVEALMCFREGIVIDECSDVLIVDTVVVSDGTGHKRGIEVANSENIELDTVLVLGSKKDGIEMTNVNGVYMNSVVSAENGKDAMTFNDCTDVNIVCSAGLDSRGDGLDMDNCDGTSVACNEFAGNRKYGISVSNSANIEFDNNDVHDNDKDDIKQYNNVGCTWVMNPCYCGYEEPGEEPR